MHHLLVCALIALALTANPTLANTASVPIPGGLGVDFGKPVDGDRLAAEIGNYADMQALKLPENIRTTLPPTEPGGNHPWRLFPGVVHPHPLRKLPSNSYIMLNREQHPIRILTIVSKSGCDETFDWVVETLTRKYEVESTPRDDSQATKSTEAERRFRVTSADRQIDVSCGPEFKLDYIDKRALKQWAREQMRRNERYARYQSEAKNHNVILQRRRSVRFADSFTMGDRFRLQGAFSIAFGKPFAEKSSQKFPFDVPFYAVLPGMPEAFTNGEVQLVISPEKLPIVIRGQFRELEFETVRQALSAKYGTAMKSTDRHVIHQVDNRHAILKKLSEDTIELAFIDTAEKEKQRERLWAAESEGL